jgi:hypothetical protein
MARNLALRLATGLLLALCIVLPAQEKREKEGSATKKGGATTGLLLRGKEKREAAEGKAEKPTASPEDVNAFRQRKDPAAVAIVELYGEIDKAYTELRTAMNVASGDDKQARKAKTEVKTLEDKIKRQTRLLTSAVTKFAQPVEREYRMTKGKYDELQERARAFEEQKQEKRATATYQQADRYNAQLDASKRLLATVRSFLYFESAEGLEPNDEANEAKGGNAAKEND